MSDLASLSKPKQKIELSETDVTARSLVQFLANPEYFKTTMQYGGTEVRMSGADVFKKMEKQEFMNLFVSFAKSSNFFQEVSQTDVAKALGASGWKLMPAKEGALLLWMNEAVRIAAAESRAEKTASAKAAQDETMARAARDKETKRNNAIEDAAFDYAPPVGFELREGGRAKLEAYLKEIKPENPAAWLKDPANQEILKANAEILAKSKPMSFALRKAEPPAKTMEFQRSKDFPKDRCSVLISGTVLEQDLEKANKAVDKYMENPRIMRIGINQAAVEVEQLSPPFTSLKESLPGYDVKVVDLETHLIPAGLTIKIEISPRNQKNK